METRFCPCGARLPFQFGRGRRRKFCNNACKMRYSRRVDNYMGIVRRGVKSIRRLDTK